MHGRSSALPLTPRLVSPQTEYGIYKMTGQPTLRDVASLQAIILDMRGKTQDVNCSLCAFITFLQASHPDRPDTTCTGMGPVAAKNSLLEDDDAASLVVM